MPIVFIPQKGEEYAFYEWRFCLSILSLPSGDLNTFYEVRHCVWVWSWVGEGMNTHHTLFVFSFVAGFQLFFLPNWILLLLKNDPSREISQTSEIWEFVPGIRETHGFQMERQEEAEVEEKRKWVGESKASRKPELWITSACLVNWARSLTCSAGLPVDNVPGLKKCNTVPVIIRK